MITELMAKLRELLLLAYHDIQKIKKKLEIEEDRFIEIGDYEKAVSDYEEYAKNELGIV